MRELTWKKCLPPVSDEAIRSIEERLGVRFPPDYLECVKRCDGGLPTENHFSYPDPSLGFVETSIGHLLSLDSTRKGCLLDVIKWSSDQLPAGIVPFADEPGGDLVCFDYRQGTVPTVVYWMHEFSGEKAVVPMAVSFAAFLEQLRP